MSSNRFTMGADGFGVACVRDEDSGAVLYSTDRHFWLGNSDANTETYIEGVRALWSLITLAVELGPEKMAALRDLTATHSADDLRAMAALVVELGGPERVRAGVELAEATWASADALDQLIKAKPPFEGKWHRVIVSWDRLLPEWDALAALLDHEMSTRTDGTAPRTYRAMKRVLAAGVECGTCHGSGESAACPKCKGTGRRSGGRCRAPQCYRGALPCPICDGRGYDVLLEIANSEASR